ncbi:PP2C family protein-serine/threonine phosphatase [Oceanobacillus chungangensis]|nr:protein phosphatase 2C domain-containing protein [Oceanobacillus chungangensis]
MNKNWQIGIASHQGTKKDKNEDSYFHQVSSDNDGNEIALFAVADGMGGYQLGDTASQIAISSIEEWWEKRSKKITKRRNALQRILIEGEQIVQQINKTIKAASSHTGKKMGTTLSLLVLYKGEYGVIHIGDSRVYRMKGWNYGLKQYLSQKGPHLVDSLNRIDEQQTEILESEPELMKLTEDHSWVGKQVESGQLSEEEARNHPKRNVLTQCLGIDNNVHPYISSGTYQSTDLFLLCSDGFYTLFSNEEIKNMLISLEKEYGSLQAISDYLINFSNFSDAFDNVTLMLVRHRFAASQVKTKRTLAALFKGM